MNDSPFCTCSAEIVAKLGYEIRNGKTYCLSCGLIEASEFVPVLRDPQKFTKAKNQRLSDLLARAWGFVFCQGLVGGIALGNIFPSTSCDSYSCNSGFNWGLFFAGFVGTVTFFGPFIFILQGIVEVGKTDD